MFENYSFKSRLNMQSSDGFYETYTIRLHHPKNPFAFWLRYTILKPEKYPENTIGELWGSLNSKSEQNLSECTNNSTIDNSLHSKKNEKTESTSTDSDIDYEKNGKNIKITTPKILKNEIPFTCCHIHPKKLQVTIGMAELNREEIYGSIDSEKNILSWNLIYKKESEAIFPLPKLTYLSDIISNSYAIISPVTSFHGEIQFNKERISVQNWLGTITHSWGTKHSKYHMRAQSVFNSDAQKIFLDISFTKIKSADITLITLLFADKIYKFPIISNQSEIDNFNWSFYGSNPFLSIKGTVYAPKESFKACNFYNPQGGANHLISSQTASCEITLFFKDKKERVDFKSCFQTSFEIITSDKNHNIPVLF
ncbi:hypothetical protein JXR93_08225 [bacterium]|nr:hypothetical protein [bacterium]